MPNISTRSLPPTAAIDILERRFIATYGITRAFLKADMDEFVILILHGKEIDALLQANTNYKEYIHKLENYRMMEADMCIKAWYVNNLKISHRIEKVVILCRLLMK